MGYAYCGEDSQGRSIGYGIAATCDHPGCDTAIDRGMSYACGGNHGQNEHDCEGYFCSRHLFITSVGFLCDVCFQRWTAWVCEHAGCDAPATGTAIQVVDAGEERIRLCAKHGAMLTSQGVPYVCDEPVRVLRDGAGWEIVDGFGELKAASDTGQSPIKGTDRATGAPVWVTLGEGHTILVDPRVR